MAREPVIDAATLPKIKLICGAITRQRVLAFTYKGADRTAEPYILGADRRGTLFLSAVQRTGGSGHGFRSFPLEGLSRLNVTDRKFFGNHPDYNPSDPFFEARLCRVKPRE